MNWKKKDAVLILTVLLIAGAAFGVHEFAGGDGVIRDCEVGVVR